MLTSGIVLHYIGFDEAVQVQAADTITNLRIADIVIPIFAGILAILVMWKYDINEAKSNEIREALILRRGERKTLEEVKKDTITDVITTVKNFTVASKWLLLAPIQLEEGRALEDKLKVLLQQGFARPSGSICNLANGRIQNESGITASISSSVTWPGLIFPLSLSEMPQL
jgi:hypothetical protein